MSNEPAVGAGPDLGLYSAARFRVTTGADAGPGVVPQARWYFRDETIAVPADPATAASFARGVRVDEDLRAWLAARTPDAAPDFPPLVWTAAPHVVAGATLDAEASALAVRDGVLAFSLVPKLPLNRSWFDASSARFFAGRRVKVRGSVAGRAIVARTLWPEDWRLAALPPLRPLPSGLPAADALRARMRAEPSGGAASPFAAETLWCRDGTSGDLRGRAVLGVMVNGAQGDDDEAHAGHFALITGRVQDDGAIGDWLVANFYNLDVESEKGTLAAPVPLDGYLADLNAGQAWYRPSVILVAVLADDRAPALLSSALGRVYNQFWRGQIAYHHPTRNCTSVSVDTLVALGLPVPARGGTPKLLAALAFPFLVARDRSVRKAMDSYDYAVAEPTRLLPAAAFEAVGARLLALATAGRTSGEARGTLEAMLAEDLDALVYLRFPQIPSSRAIGDAPVATLREYRARLPRDPAQLKIVPVPPRTLPASLRDPDLVPAPAPPSELVATIWAALSIVGIPWAWRRWRRWRGRRRARSGR